MVIFKCLNGNGTFIFLFEALHINHFSSLFACFLLHNGHLTKYFGCWLMLEICMLHLSSAFSNDFVLPSVFNIITWTLTSTDKYVYIMSVFQNPSHIRIVLHTLSTP